MIQFFPLKFPFLIFYKQKEEKGKKSTSRSSALKALNNSISALDEYLLIISLLLLNLDL